MTEKTIKLSATGRSVLMLAAIRGDRLVPPPSAAERWTVHQADSKPLVSDLRNWLDVQITIAGAQSYGRGHPPYPEPLERIGAIRRRWAH